MTTYLVINAHMWGTPNTPGEHVNWSEPDLFDDQLFLDLCGETVEEFAESSPHMIVMVVDPS